MIKVPRGASAAAPLHVVIGDGYGGSSFGPDGGGQRAKGNGVVNFIFYRRHGVRPGQRGG